MKGQLLALIPVCLLVYLSVAATKAEEGKKIEQSPHAEAIQLILTTQQETIRKIDQGDWWQDVKERQWNVKRPFGPGNTDSTHMFEVSYHIEGRAVYSWLVDTRAKKVQGQEIPDKVKKE